MLQKGDGALWAMGSNENGKMGAGKDKHYLMPVFVANDVATVLNVFKKTKNLIKK